MKCIVSNSDFNICLRTIGPLVVVIPALTICSALANRSLVQAALAMLNLDVDIFYWILVCWQVGVVEIWQRAQSLMKTRAFPLVSHNFFRLRVGESVTWHFLVLGLEEQEVLRLEVWQLRFVVKVYGCPQLVTIFVLQMSPFLLIFQDDCR